MENNDLVNGFFAKEPHNNAPDFVKGKISIKLSDFAQYLRELKASDPDIEWLNLDIKVSKQGKWYAMRDTWVPDASKASAPAPAPAHNNYNQPNDDVPF